ncbi:uncharacterized protein V1518DRAFT_237066 [Limtongia smithiae]|uniref:uncharacterized protein n=1 Tax=Limtongia smithiae TaxID=1125753 RepID=UPI0034CD81A0
MRVVLCIGSHGKSDNFRDDIGAAERTATALNTTARNGRCGHVWRTLNVKTIDPIPRREFHPRTATSAELVHVEQHLAEMRGICVKLELLNPLRDYGERDVRVLWSVPASYLDASPRVVDLIYSINAAFPDHFIDVEKKRHALLFGGLGSAAGSSSTGKFQRPTSPSASLLAPLTDRVLGIGMEVVEYQEAVVDRDSADAQQFVPAEFACETSDGFRLCLWNYIADTIRDGDLIRIRRLESAERATDELRSQAFLSNPFVEPTSELEGSTALSCKTGLAYPKIFGGVPAPDEKLLFVAESSGAESVDPDFTELEAAEEPQEGVVALAEAPVSADIAAPVVVEAPSVVQVVDAPAVDQALSPAVVEEPLAMAATQEQITPERKRQEQSSIEKANGTSERSFTDDDFADEEQNVKSIFGKIQGAISMIVSRATPAKAFLKKKDESEIDSSEEDRTSRNRTDSDKEGYSDSSENAEVRHASNSSTEPKGSAQMQTFVKPAQKEKLRSSNSSHTKNKSQRSLPDGRLNMSTFRPEKSYSSPNTNTPTTNDNYNDNNNNRPASVSGSSLRLSEPGKYNRKESQRMSKGHSTTVLAESIDALNPQNSHKLDIPPFPFEQVNLDKKWHRSSSSSPAVTTPFAQTMAELKSGNNHSSLHTPNGGNYSQFSFRPTSNSGSSGGGGSSSNVRPRKRNLDRSYENDQSYDYNYEYSGQNEYDHVNAWNPNKRQRR